MNVDDLLPSAISMIIALFGGVARYIYFLGRKKVTLKAFSAASLISAFTGFLAYQLCIYSGWEGALMYIVLGLAGYTAPALVDGLSLTISHIGQSMRPPTKK